MSTLDIVKYQIVNYCYFNKIPLSDAAALCLAKLSIRGKTDLNKFCNQMSEEKVFASAQVVRNTLTLSEERKLIIKEGKKPIIIEINPDINVQNSGNILLEYKLFAREPA